MGVRKTMKIKLKTLVEFQIYYLMIVIALVDLLHLPNVIRYLLDVNMLVIIFFILFRGTLEKKHTKQITGYVMAYMIILVVLSAMRVNPVGQIFWGVRNNFFYIIFFLVCVKVFEFADVERIFDNLVKLQTLNVLCGLYEYYILDMSGDYFGGMFGYQQGCNGHLNVYLMVISAYAVCKYTQNKMHIFRMVWILLSSVLMATLGELKIFYVELLMIVILCLLLNRQKIKSMLVFVSAIAVIFVGVQILSVTYEESVAVLYNIENVLEYNSIMDYGSGDIRIARFTVIAQINEYFFGDNFLVKLFGYGLGACESSQTFSWANSTFADRYGYLQYRDLSSAMNYLETGFLGVMAFLLIFIIIFMNVQKFRKCKFANCEDYINVFAQIMCLMAIVCIFYNSSVRREIAYLLFFSLSSSYVYMKKYDNEVASMSID